MSVDGAKVYLIGHGYAPVFKVTDARGKVVYDQATPFVAGATGNFLSEGVVKVPDAQPDQLGFTGVFVPTAVNVERHARVGVPGRRQPGREPDRLRREPGRGLRPLAVRLPARHHRDEAADVQPAGAEARPVADAARRPGHDHVHRLRAVGQPGHHPRSRSAARPDLRHGRAGRAAALVHDPPQAGLRPRQRRPAGCRPGRHHSAGRRPGPDRRQRRLRSRVRGAGGRAQVGARAGRPRDPASNNPNPRESEGPCPST